MIADNVEIKSGSISEAIGALEHSLKAYENSYATTSAKMLRAVRSEEIRETAEIAQWLTDYHVLKRLEAQYGDTTGNPRNSIKPSTIST